MAQRTGPERFLGSLLKAAGAGLIPVLVAAVLLGLAGCGGGSDAQTTANAESKTTTQSPSVSNKGKQGHLTSEAEQAGAASRVEAAGAARGSGKHGPAVAAPKGEEEPEITPQQREEATVASISFSSPSLPKTESVAVLPADYTCDGANKWPAFSWSGIPAGTKEVALLMMNTQPVDEKLFFDWAIAGIDPSSDGIGAGELPAGAVVGKNSFGRNGYSICPPKGKAETFMLLLYALPKPLSSKQGFDPLELREEAERQAGNAGLMAVSYAR